MGDSELFIKWKQRYTYTVTPHLNNINSMDDTVYATNPKVKKYQSITNTLNITSKLDTVMWKSKWTSPSVTHTIHECRRSHVGCSAMYEGRVGGVCRWRPLPPTSHWPSTHGSIQHLKHSVAEDIIMVL